MSGWSGLASAGWLAGGLLIAGVIVAGGVLGGWGWARVASGLAGCVLLVLAAAGLHDPLSSMTDYIAGLMALNQLSPPLLLLALPARVCDRLRGAPAPRPAPGLRGWLFDPVVAASLFATVSVAISLPGLFEPALADALFSAPLGLVELACGLLLWAQLFWPLRTIGPDWAAGGLALAASVPMTAVAVVWMLSPVVVYAPYLDVICRWNIPPLADQKWAAFVMLLAGLPLQIAGSWRLVRLPVAPDVFRAPTGGPEPLA